MKNKMRPVTINLAVKQLSVQYFALKMDNFALIVQPKSTCKLDKLKRRIQILGSIAQFAKFCVPLSKA